MQKIIQQVDDQYLIQEDTWQVVRPAVANEGETAPELTLADVPSGAVILPLDFWKSHKAELIASRPVTQLGVWLAPNQHAETVIGEFDSVSVIAIDFPIFRDGRGYSTAALLRTRYGWKGALRSIGDVLHDQLTFMSRCGFNQMALRADKDIQDALRAFKEITVQYQGAVSQPLPLFRRREAHLAGAKA